MITDGSTVHESGATPGGLDEDDPRALPVRPPAGGVMTAGEPGRTGGADLVARGAGCAMLVLAAWTSWGALYALAFLSPSFLPLGTAVIVVSALGVGLIIRGARPRWLRLAIGVGLALAVYFAVGVPTETTEGSVSVKALFAILSLTVSAYAAIALARSRPSVDGPVGVSTGGHEQTPRT